MSYASDTDIIGSLPLVELISKEERSKGFKKYRAMKVAEFRKYNPEYVRIIPHGDSGIKEDEFFKLLSMKDLMGKLSAEVYFAGGWVLYNGDFICEFLGSDEFKRKYRFINGTDIEYLKREQCFQITKISDSKRDDGSKVIMAGGTSWMMNADNFEILTPRVNDFLIFSSTKRYKIVRQKDMETITRSTRETNYSDTPVPKPVAMMVTDQPAEEKAAEVVSVVDNVPSDNFVQVDTAVAPADRGGVYFDESENPMDVFAPAVNIEGHRIVQEDVPVEDLQPVLPDPGYKPHVLQVRPYTCTEDERQKMEALQRGFMENQQ